MTSVKAIRSVRKLEKPRPLKFVSTQNRQTIADTTSLRTKTTAESVLQDLETLSKHINNGNYDTSLGPAVTQLCSDLKLYGSQLDSKYKDQVDRHFVSLRNGSRDVRLDILSRTRLLEVIELRAMQWQTNENINNYYRDKLAQASTQQQQPSTPPFQNITNTSSLILQNSTSPASLFYINNNNPALSPLPQQSVLAPGEILKSSGKYTQPTRVPGKNYYKDEVIIRNADSGKVMGIKGRRVHMIEELSETIISFQRVNPGAKDRLVQITGPNEESIENAKQLIEQTICRNASPIRDKLESGDFGSDTSLNSGLSEDPSHFSGSRGLLVHSFSMNDATGLGDYKYSVTVGTDKINITGPNLDLVRTAKLVLDEYFNNEQDAVFTHDGIESPTFFLHQHPKDENERITRWVQNAKPLGSDSDSPRSSGVASDDTYIASERLPAYTRTLSGDKLKLRSAKFLPGYSNLNPLAPDFSLQKKKNNLQPAKSIVYSREFLLKCATSSASQQTPKGWDQIGKDLPNIVLKHGEPFNPKDMLSKPPKMPPGVIRQSSPRDEDAN